jgi:ribokinase
MSPAGRVLVIGSLNVDLVVGVQRLPAPGETVLGSDLERHAGGKGANQAVAAARAGAVVTMIGAVGDDAEADVSVDALRSEGIDVRHLRRLPGASGVALIAVGSDGQNLIVVAPGANGRLAPDGVEEVLRELQPRAADVLLASLEVPMAAVLAAAGSVARAGGRVLVNPAPAAPLPPELFALRPFLTPNRTELAQLATREGLEAGARSLLERGAAAVIVTCGDAGSLLVDDESHVNLPALAIPRVVDTTGAGDTFSGVLASWLAEGRSLGDAQRAATVAAGLSVTRAGARAAMPARDAIDAALRETG